ncbi:MAG: hypothetical protein ACKPJJ_37725, partial [Planctomycetaceae bacterium]
ILQQFSQCITGWMRVSFILSKAFSAGKSGFFAAGGTPASAGFGVFVHAVLSAQPFALAGVAGQCSDFCFQLF